MGDANPIRTLRDYSKPSHEGYRNTIELLVGNNVVPLRSDTIRLVQNECSFYGLRSEDPNQHIKDFLKLMDSLDLDGENRERTRLRLFQFPLLEQASNWLERLPAGSITTWEDLTTRFLAQFFLPGRTSKLRNNILMFQQHHRESRSSMLEACYWYYHEDFMSSLERGVYAAMRLFVKCGGMKTTGSSMGDMRLKFWFIGAIFGLLINMALVNKITTLCEICSGPHDTQYCMEDPEQAYVEYASSRTDEAGEGLVSNFMASQDARLSKFEADFKQQQSEMTSKINTMLKAITNRLAGALPSDTVKNPKMRLLQFCLLANISQTSQLQTGMGIETGQTEEPKSTLEDEFQDLHLNLPVLEVLAHALIYNEMLDKYVERLELGENGSAVIQGEVSVKIEDPGLFTLPCRLGDSKPFDTLADLGSCVSIIPLYLFKKLNIILLEETDHIFGLADGTKSYPVRIVKDLEVHIGKLKLLNDFYVIDIKKDPKTPLLVGRGFLATARL
ncbi:MAK10-like protein [Tanacetum coccineum]